jgi:membrane associated protein
LDLWINEKRLGKKSINQIFNFVLLFVMRKSIGLLVLLSCVVILSACTQESVHKKQTSLTYSNLVDTGSRAQLAQLLADAGISEQSISGLMSNIIHFNQIAGAGNLISGFVTTGTLEPIYDQGKIQDLWAEKSPNFIGYNCRLTSFDLMKDLIKVQTPQS